MNNLTIRPALLADWPNYQGLLTSSPALIWGLQQYFPTHWVAELNKKIVGYLGLWCHEQEATLIDLGVEPTSQRQGIATKLLHRMKNYLCQHQIPACYLEVLASNRPAIQLYRRHYFIPIQMRKNYYQNPMEDGLIMQYTLGLFQISKSLRLS